MRCSTLYDTARPKSGIVTTTIDNAFGVSVVAPDPAHRLVGVLHQRRVAFATGVGRVVEQTFGVDTFQITPSLTDPTAQSSRLIPGARLTIGKRISNRVYLTFSQSLSASSTSRDQVILLEYDQNDRLSWVLSQNEDRTYALDVRVRYVF